MLKESDCPAVRRGFFLGVRVIQQHSERIADSASKMPTDISLAMAGMNIYFGLTVQDWCLAVGAFCGVSTMVINWWYQRQRLRLEVLVAEKNRGVDASEL